MNLAVDTHDPDELADKILILVDRLRTLALDKQREAEAAKREIERLTTKETPCKT